MKQIAERKNKKRRQQLREAQQRFRDRQKGLGQVSVQAYLPERLTRKLDGDDCGETRAERLQVILKDRYQRRSQS